MKTKGKAIKTGNESQTEIKGVHTFSFCSIESEEAQTIQKLIVENITRRAFITRMQEIPKELRHSLWLEYRSLIMRLHKFKVREKVVCNVTTTAGRTLQAERLSGDTTYTGVVNYTALGDDNTAANEADATLGNEVYRKALSSGTNLNNIAYLETFFTAAEVNGTFEEYGMYIDGGAGADSGQLYNRFTETNVKTALETLNVQSIITLSDA